jgi:putative lipoprotein
MRFASSAGVALASALISSLVSGSARASDTDPWFGPDKAVHCGVSVVLAAGGYAASSIWLDSRNERALAGGAFSLTLGAGKELWDLSGHGDPSWRDFTWDVIGTAAGVALAVGVDALTSSKEPRRSTSTQGLVFHF